MRYLTTDEIMKAKLNFCSKNISKSTEAKDIMKCLSKVIIGMKDGGYELKIVVVERIKDKRDMECECMIEGQDGKNMLSVDTKTRKWTDFLCVSVCGRV